ncbi:MAG TPA: TIGR01459 family HAD-type hydrolase [Sphingomicrobium sp.]|nr:TIGR01459 family HAD-type hydrolase [Sphingomicrobium sp.]
MNFLDALPERYRLILCDIWGVVHDGFHLYPGAAERLRRFREEGRTVVLITNAPRTTAAIEEDLIRIGLPRDAWDGIATGGQAGIDALRQCAEPVGFLGTEEDREILLGGGVVIAEGDGFTDLACTGLPNPRGRPEDYLPELEVLAERDVLMHCLNPDRVVIHGGVAEYCAGALADRYVELGGCVEFYGKPYPAIYHHALALAGNPPASEVLAIGDGLQTDILGAARMGFDAVFVTGGINAGKPFPADFGSTNGLGEWKPVAIVEGLELSA